LPAWAVGEDGLSSPASACGSACMLEKMSVASPSPAQEAVANVAEGPLAATPSAKTGAPFPIHGFAKDEFELAALQAMQMLVR